jgi:hypothetical protein
MSSASSKSVSRMEFLSAHTQPHCQVAEHPVVEGAHKRPACSAIGKVRTRRWLTGRRSTTVRNRHSHPILGHVHLSWPTTRPDPRAVHVLATTASHPCTATSVLNNAPLHVPRSRSCPAAQLISIRRKLKH